jgi:hypothetical protein
MLQHDEIASWFVPPCRLSGENQKLIQNARVDIFALVLNALKVILRRFNPGVRKRNEP